MHENGVWAIACWMGALAVCASLEGCQGNGKPALIHCDLKVDGDILIGEFLPFEGDLATFGPYMDPGVAQAIMEINSGGGIFGKSLGYVQCDTKGDPSVTIAALAELLDNFRIPAMVGPILTPCTIAILDLAKQNHILMNTFNQLPQVSTLEDDGFVFRTTASVHTMIPIAVRTAREMDLTRAFSFHQDDGYGNMLYSIFKEQFEAAGGQTRDFSYRPKDDDNYAEEAVAAARASFQPQGPQFIMNITFVEDGAAIMRTALTWRKTPDAPLWFMFNAQKNPEFVRQIGGIEAAIGVHGCALGDAANDDYAAFAAEFRRLWGNEPYDFSANAYDAVYTVAIAMALSADPSDGIQVRDNMANVTSGTVIHPGQWPEVLEHASEGKLNYEGASGPIDYDANGDVTQKIFTWYVDADATYITTCWNPDGTPCE